MARLQKQQVDVRLLGLDEKANPRVAPTGTITDGRNWDITKEGRVTKRGGITVLTMLDTAGATITGGRDLGKLDEELLLGNRKKWYAKNPIDGSWIARGYSSLERVDIRATVATNATCDGSSSRLQMDSATIGRYVLTVMSGGTTAGGTDSGGWFVTDSTTGEVLTSVVTSMPYLGVSVGTDGAAAPTFVAFAGSAGNLKAAIWDQTTGFRALSLTWDNVITDLNTGAHNLNTYSLQPTGAALAPYAVVRVAASTWLVAYHQATTDKLVVRKLTLAGTTFTASAAVDITTTGSVRGFAISWCFSAGDAYATLAGVGGAFSPLSIYTAAIVHSTMVVTSHSSIEPAAWNTGTSVGNATCWNITGIPSSTAYFFIEATSITGQRAIWLWRAGDADVTLFLDEHALLCQAWVPTGGESDEVCVGVAHYSSWQPSSFILRAHLSGGVCTGWSIGAHLQAGNFAGCPTATHLPSMAVGGSLALGNYNNPEKLGGNGTVLVCLATFTDDTRKTAGPPEQVGESALIPGACLKLYDGMHVTEAAFPLGPESVSVVESTAGVVYNVTDAGVITLDDVAIDGDDLTTALGSIAIQTATGVPNLATWPAGVVTLDFWAKVVTPTAGVTYSISRGPAAPSYVITTDGSIAWQDTTYTSVDLTEAWQHFRYSISVKSLAATTSAKLKIAFDLTTAGIGAPGTGVLHISTGAAMPLTIETPFPVLEVGARDYCACLAWTDAKGRTQRSQISPVASVTNVSGLAIGVTIPNVCITERDHTSNLDAAIAHAVIEVYRTQVNSAIFYRVATLANNINHADVYLFDDQADTEISDNEQLYTTGGVVQNWPPIGCSAVASHQGRAFVLTADNQVFFSAYIQPGEGMAFASEYQADTSHIPGRLTAITSLDDKLVIGSATAYASQAGIGPESTGIPAYDSPMVIAGGVGPRGQRSCVRTTDGVVMMTVHGPYKLDRGLTLQDIGTPVEISAAPSTWYTAVADHTGGRVRFGGSGLMLVYDWTVSGPPNRVGQWFKWGYPVDIVASTVAALTAGSPAVYYLGSTGLVYVNDGGSNDNGASYQEWVQFSIVQPAGAPGAWARIYALRATCALAANAAAKIVFTSEDGNLTSSSTHTVTAGSGGLQHIIAKPLYGKCSSMTVWLGESAASATAGVTVDALELLVGAAGGLGRLPTTNRMARS